MQTLTMAPPTPLNPMLASTMGRRTFAEFETDAYVLEPKFDGWRYVVSKRGADVWAWGRPGRGKTGGPVAKPLPPGLLAAWRAMPDGDYDTEVMGPTGKCHSVAGALKNDTAVCVVFDVVELQGMDLADHEWEVRRAGLEVALSAIAGTVHASRLVISPTAPVSWAAVEAIYSVGGEGAIIKRRDLPYKRGHRSAEWIKVVRAFTKTMIIDGFEAGKYGPHGVTLCSHPDGTTARVATKDFATMRQIAKDGAAAWIGRRIVVKFKEQVSATTLREPKFDHMAGEGE